MEVAYAGMYHIIMANYFSMTTVLTYFSLKGCITINLGLYKPHQLVKKPLYTWLVLIVKFAALYCCVATCCRGNYFQPGSLNLLDFHHLPLPLLSPPPPPIAFTTSPSHRFHHLPLPSLSPPPPPIAFTTSPSQRFHHLPLPSLSPPPPPSAFITSPSQRFHHLPLPSLSPPPPPSAFITSPSHHFHHLPLLALLP